jgi:transcriptional regulator with XRE-family HTH domain
MVQAAKAIAAPQSIGQLLQYWRKTRNLSQLALASEAEVSPRHLCFVETGRSRPSREMVLHLARALDVPLREQNALLLAAGFAPRYAEASLDAPELAPVRSALDAILRQQQPFPAVVLNRRWDIVGANAAAGSFFAWLLDGRAPEPANVLRLMFDPRGLRPHVANWDAVADALLQRVQREAVGGVQDAATSALVRSLLAAPDLPPRLLRANLEAPLLPVVPVSFAKDGQRYDFFSAVTTLGTPQDVTVQELRIEAFFPANPETERAARAAAVAGTFAPAPLQ